MKFLNFRDINIESASTWEGKAILSFDIDWAIDPVVNDVLDLLDSVNIKATFFITHQTPILDRIRANPNYELGIHPNFNPLIEQKPHALSAKQTLENLLTIVPEAKVIRSHGMTHSGSWLTIYKEMGIKYLSQYYMGGVETIQPFAHINGLVEAPIYFADDGYAFEKELGKDFDLALSLSSNLNFLKVFNFHPIHLKLNTPNISFYNKSRAYFHSIEDLNNIKYKGHGVFSLFKKLVNLNE
tara:strand:+ start:3026 stop:3748 length:723 start_codon:yes stop_codon:yes gene_type:complete